eukprot:6180570-Pleurochrysis_carterae.AAC.2
MRFGRVCANETRAKKYYLKQDLQTEYTSKSKAIVRSKAFEERAAAAEGRCLGHDSVFTYLRNGDSHGSCDLRLQLQSQFEGNDKRSVIHAACQSSSRWLYPAHVPGMAQVYRRPAAPHPVTSARACFDVPRTASVEPAAVNVHGNKPALVAHVRGHCEGLPASSRAKVSHRLARRCTHQQRKELRTLILNFNFALAQPWKCVQRQPSRKTDALWRQGGTGRVDAGIM